MIIDLTHTLNNTTPVYPGTENPTFEQECTIDKDGFAETSITMCTHLGTHMDAPSHILKNTKSLEEFSLDKFIGSAIVLDCSDLTEISLDFILKHKELIANVNFIIFYTGWQHKWESDDYFNGFAVLSQEAADWLVNLTGLKGLGFDTISVDKITDSHLPNHNILLRKEILIIENLTNLDLLIDKPFEFNCIPLKIENSDGSPIRAFGRTT